MNNVSKPYVGLWVDFYPDNSTRCAAVVTEVHPNMGDLHRPKVNLQCFKPDGEIEPWVEVPAAEAGIDEELPDLTEKWGYQHEFMLHNDEEDDEDKKGTQTNDHVGEISLIIEEEY